MKTIELFSGTKSFSKIAWFRGHDTWTVDNREELFPDLCVDVLSKDERLFSLCDVLWASPPCTTFSVASIGTHWTGGKGVYLPKTEACELGLALLNKTIQIIACSKPKIWFIENPRGVMRKVIDGFFEKHGITDVKRHTVTYCQYGDTRMKPTDIWTNCDIEFKPPCKNGASCHEPAPRGSSTGTQGINGAKDRGVIPPALMEHVVKYCESVLTNQTEET